VGGVESLLTRYDDLHESMPIEKDALDYFQDVHDGLLKKDETIDQQKQTLIEWVNNNVE
jgi:hypothetical protein